MSKLSFKTVSYLVYVSFLQNRIKKKKKAVLEKSGVSWNFQLLTVEVKPLQIHLASARKVCECVPTQNHSSPRGNVKESLVLQAA